MNVDGRVAQVILGYLKNYVLESGYRVGGASDKALKTAFDNEAFLMWVNAYAEHVPGFEGKLREILMDLSSSRNDDFESIFQKGLLSVLSEEKLEMLEFRLNRALSIPFEKSVKLARKYLPKRTRVKADVYITIDPFNTAMMRPGKVFLSILQEDLTPKSAKWLAHEFHHVGAFYWLNKNLKLTKLRNSNEHAQMLYEVFSYFITEGLANWYASSWTTRIIEGEEKHNKTIRKLEKERPQLMKDLEQLLNLICERHKPVEEIKTLFKSLSINTSGSGIPTGHFLSGRMVGAMDNSNIIAKNEIIDLVKHPFDFFDLYNKTVDDSDKLNITLLKHVKNKTDEWSTTIRSNA
jgi:hypothetical protein